MKHPDSLPTDNPPKNWLKFLRWYCSADYLEEVEGDLRERFEQTVAQRGLAKARRQFAGGVLRFFNYSTIRGSGNRSSQQNILSMYRNFLIIALRRLRREKGYATLHLLGLSLGICVALLLGMYIQYEKSYDQFLPQSARTYKLVEARTVQGETTQRGVAPYAFAQILPERFPSVENATAISGPYHEQQVTVAPQSSDPKHFLEGHVYLADSNFLEVIPFEILEGDPHTALQDPHSVVLTASTAQRFFGTQSALGKELTVSSSPSVVTAVVADPPAHSQFQFSYLVSSASVRWFSAPNFSMAVAHCFVTLREGVQPTTVQAQLPDIVTDYVAPEIAEREGKSWEAFQAEGNDYHYSLRPLTSVHLDPDDIGQMKPMGNARLLSILALVALLIVALAIVNYVNFSHAYFMLAFDGFGRGKVD
ncbi:MAG: ABC transporter permease, partial [Bacteroidota bacterium]